MKRIGLALLFLILTVSTARAQISDVVLDSLQYTSFQYFWNEVNPANGLIKDRSTPGSPASIAATGFGLSAICIGVDHGWITRAQARARVLTTLNTFWSKPQGPTAIGTIGYKGLYYHFLDMNSGLRTWESELSTIDTALLFAGILDAKQYFDTADPTEEQIRALADSIYRRADWSFVRDTVQGGIRMGWKPVSGFSGFGRWIGYNEAMIMYVMAIGSPTHPIPGSDWNVWISGYNWMTQNGYSFVICPPLFTHQYSHCWIDFRGIQDVYMRFRGITYFENSRRATLAQKAYARVNGFHWFGVSDSLWGFTASDDPDGYAAHGAPPPQSENGTITPTAPISSLPFAADSVWSCIRNLYTNYKVFPLWGRYGFTDAFNIQRGWVGQDYLGIDQGPITMMIENYRSQRVWMRFMQNADIQRGLTLADFQPVATGVGEPPHATSPGVRLEAEPNPFRGVATLRFVLPHAGRVRLTVYDLQGREVAALVNERRVAGAHAATFDGTGLPAGVYLYRLELDGASFQKRVVLLQ